MLRNVVVLQLLKFPKQKFGFQNFSSNVANVLQSGQVGDKISLKGWVKFLRKQKENIFLDLNDGMTGRKIQVILPPNLLKEALTVGASIQVSGVLGTSPKGQIEVHASDIEVYGPCVLSDGYPFSPKKQYTPEYVRQYLHIRPRTQKFSSLLRVRSATTSAITEFFKNENYTLIHTPIITSNDCEGAGEVFKVIPDNKQLLKAMAKSNLPLEESFFNKKTFLTVSGQLHLEAAVHGLSKVYSFGPTFRAENSKSRLHLSEFYMLEAEVAFIDSLEDIIQAVENLIKTVTKSILDLAKEDIVNCQESNSLSIPWLNVKFPVLIFNDAVQILKENHNKFKDKHDSSNGFSKEQELFLVKYFGDVPVFIVNWPKNLKPFYAKKCPNDNTKVLAFDLLAPNVGELVGGSLRENNLEELRTEIHNDADFLDWYLELRKFGSVPTGGYGMGFERYLMFLLGIENIKDVIPFPRWPHNCNL